jgi:hypothetical protein
VGTEWGYNGLGYTVTNHFIPFYGDIMLMKCDITSQQYDMGLFSNGKIWAATCSRYKVAMQRTLMWIWDYGLW